MGPVWRSCALLVVDIEGFASPTRSDPLRVLLRQRLHELLEHALTAIGAVAGQVVMRRDLGDGLLVALQPTVSTGRLAHQAITELAQGLARHNQAADSTAARLRLRVAMHQGQLLQDLHGFTSQALTHAFRMIDAEVIRAALRSVPTAHLVVVISDPVHHALTGRALGWQPIWLANKETIARCWIHLPGVYPQPPVARLLTMSDPLPAALSTDEVEQDVVRRRALLAYSGTLDGGAGLEILVGERHLSMVDVMVAQQVAQRLHHTDESIPVAQLHVGLARHALAVDRLARRAEDPKMLAGLLRALALTQAIRGFVAVYDRADYPHATACFRIALQAAWELDDPVVMGLVCQRMSDAARHAGDCHLALEHARAGSRLVGRADLALQATLQLAIAYAHDGLGQTRAALHALDAGQHLIESPQLRASPWMRMDPARFAGCRGFTEAVCRLPEQATVSLRTGIHALPAGNGHRAVLLALLARVRFAQEDPEQAAQLVGEALAVARQLESRSRLAAVCILDPYLRRYRTVPEVRELADQFRQAHLPTYQSPGDEPLLWPHLGQTPSP
jgi:hypothetical protein